MRPAKLHTLEVVVVVGSPAAEVPTNLDADELLRAMVQVLNPVYLRSFRLLADLDIHYAGGLMHTGRAACSHISAESIGALCLFSQLRRIRIGTLWYLQPDDTSLQDMARSWPQIQSLVFDQNLDVRRISRVTWFGLHEFAESCADIVELGICMSITSPLPDPATIPISNVTLTTLLVGTSRFTRVKAKGVARVLLAMFPNITHVVHPLSTTPANLRGSVKLISPRKMLHRFRKWDRVSARVMIKE